MSCPARTAEADVPSPRPRHRLCPVASKPTLKTSRLPAGQAVLLTWTHISRCSVLLPGWDMEGVGSVQSLPPRKDRDKGPCVRGSCCCQNRKCRNLESGHRQRPRRLRRRGCMAGAWAAGRSISLSAWGEVLAAPSLEHVSAGKGHHWTLFLLSEENSHQNVFCFC